MQHDFDIASITYDITFTNTSIGKAQRKQVYNQLKEILATEKQLSILELNCGTGEDANYFHTNNHKVTATDISLGMITEAKKKYEDINFKQLDINKLHQNEFFEKFDFIFSNFGGFNCLSKHQIITFFDSVNKKIAKNGIISLVIMPKKTFWEKIYFSLKGDFSKGKRRNTTTSVAANVDGVDVNTWYFNPDEISKIATNFIVKKIKPIGLFVPPSYLQSSFLGKKTMVHFLSFLDSLFAFSFLAKYADHYYIELQKKSNL